MHDTQHPLSGQTVTVHAGYLLNRGPVETLPPGDYEFQVEDWYDRLIPGDFWETPIDNFVAANYAFRAGVLGLPMDDEIVYGQIDVGKYVDGKEGPWLSYAFNTEEFA